MKNIIKLLGIIILTTMILFTMTACDEDDSSDLGGNPDGGSNPTNPGNTSGGNLYAKAPPISSSDTPVNLSGISGATIVEKSFNYINANSGTYTLVLYSDIDVEGEGFYSEKHLKNANTKLTIIGSGAERKINLTSIIMFTIGEPGQTGIALTLGDNITLDGNVQSSSRRLVDVRHGASFTMQGNSKITGGGGVRVEGSTFIMQDNSSVSRNDGVGVYLASGWLDLNTIDSTLYSTFIMKDNSSVSGNRFGGVDVFGGDFTMQDNASVSGNYDGSGVTVWIGTFTMQGNAAVTGNHYGRGDGGNANGGGVHVGGYGPPYIDKEYTAYFNMQGGTISGNYANYGGGVNVGSYGAFTMSGGIIYGSNEPNENLRNNSMNNNYFGASLCVRQLYGTTKYGTAKYGDGTSILTSGETRTNDTIIGRP